MGVILFGFFAIEWKSTKAEYQYIKIQYDYCILLTVRSDPSSVSQSVQVHLSGVATKAQPLGKPH